jgi:hypothetical protein
MRYLFVLLSALLLIACGDSAPVEVLTYRITCPLTMTETSVDTVRGTMYFYSSTSLDVYTGSGINRVEFPKNCVVKEIQ